MRNINEDLFENTRMSFGEHIEELRQCLVRALYGLAICCIFGFYYADQIIKYLQRPLEVAIRDFELQIAKRKMIEKYGFFDPEFDYWIDDQGQAPRTVLISRDQLALLAGSTSASSNVELAGLDLNPVGAVAIARRLSSEMIANDGNTEGEQLKIMQAAAIWDLLEEEERQYVRKLASKSIEADEADVALMRTLLKRISDETELFKQAAFSHLIDEPKLGWFDWFTSSDSVKTLPLIKQRVDNAKSADLLLQRKLNRALIRDTFSVELSPPRADLVPIEIWETIVPETQSLSPHEPFMIWMKAGFFASFVLASPWILYQLWTFVSAGLYPHEKRYVHWYLPISVFLFFAGVSLAFFFVLTPVLNFLFAFNQTMGITPQLRINYWLSFVMYLPLGFGIAFQLPLVMLVLNRLGIVEISVFLSKWRIAIMAIFVVSMFLTPADPLSMVLLALPLTLLYFLGIALCVWMPRNRNPFGEVSEPV